MNILLTNESGCFAPGVIALAKALSTRHRVVIVAPLHPQNNTGHAFTSNSKPLRVKQYFALNKVKIFSVNGTPCDCVTLALDKILHSKPDLIISGISDKLNRGEFIYSSGVVQSAIEGTIQGVPSISVSANIRDISNEKNFQAVANTFVKNLPYFMKNMPYGTTLNVNYPEKFSPRKIVCTHMTTKIIDDSCEYEVNPFGNTFYWYKPSTTGFAMSALDQKGDLYWLNKNYITVTPLKLDLTCDESMEIIIKGGIVL